jgi:hypothetical protein
MNRRAEEIIISALPFGARLYPPLNTLLRRGDAVQRPQERSTPHRPGQCCRHLREENTARKPVSQQLTDKT